MQNISKLLVVCSLFVSQLAHAQTSKKSSADDFSVQGQSFINAGIGIGTYYKGLPFGASYEYGITDAISVGGFVDYSSYNNSDIGYKLNILYFGVRGSYHFATLLGVENPKFDPYGGVSLGYYHVGYSINDNDFPSPYSSSVFVGIHVGARYWFANAIGGFAEAGYGVAPLKLGVTFKL